MSNRAIEATEATDADRADGRRPTPTDDAAGGIKGQEGGAPDRPPKVLISVSDHIAESVRRSQAERYRATDPPDQLVWNLARRLLAHDHIDAENAFDLLSEHCPGWFNAWGICEEDAEFAMLEALESVIYPHGQGPLELATRRAADRPVRLLSEHRKGPRKSRIYERFLGVARELQEQMGDGPVMLPARRLGQALEVGRMTAWRCVRLAQSDGIVQEVQPHEFNQRTGTVRATRWRVDLDRLDAMTAADPTPLQREEE